MKKSSNHIKSLIALPFAALQAQTDNDSEVFDEEISEFKLNDSASVRLKRISKNEYIIRKERVGTSEA